MKGHQSVGQQDYKSCLGKGIGILFLQPGIVFEFGGGGGNAALGRTTRRVWKHGFRWYLI